MKEIAGSDTQGLHPKPIFPVTVRSLGQCDYLPVWQSMREYTDARNADSTDQIWLLQHNPVYTLGLNGKPEHILNPLNIPVVHCDRGGQVTYHGPGQLVIYVLLDLKRLNLGVKSLVYALEQSVIDLLAELHITSRRIEGAPGVYVGDAKIAALGLRIRRGYCYHGLSLNINMDLEPFKRINPCGFSNMPVCQLNDLVACDFHATELALLTHVAKTLHIDYTLSPENSRPVKNRDC